MAKMGPRLDEDTGVTSESGSTTGITRWQEVVGVIGVVAVLWAGSNLFDAVTRSGGRPRGPGPAIDSPGENREQGSDAEDGGVHVPGPPAGGH